MRQPVIAGNWKMFKTIGEASVFLEQLRVRIGDITHCDVVIAPPFTAIRAASEAVRGTRMRVGAQDLHWDREGAHTGDVSAAMLIEAGATHVIVGHSERRQDHGETDEVVNRKLKAALASRLVPIVCLGETLAEREEGKTESTLRRQFTFGFSGLTASDFSHIMVAYEPVWAIGTGKTATPEMAAESHKFIRQLVRSVHGDTVAASLRILYGGSVKPANIADLMAQEEIDGALVGGASLEVNSFVAIVNYPRGLGAR